MKRLRFQSTRPRGARPAGYAAMKGKDKVSIHAPAWGATPAGGRPSESPACFNPRARVGRDVLAEGREQDDQEFQSTRPRGARPGTLEAEGSHRVFQSTRPRGARR